MYYVNYLAVFFCFVYIPAKLFAKCLLMLIVLRDDGSV